MNYKIPRGCSLIGEITQVVIVLGPFPPCAGVHNPPLPLHRSLFTRASAMVGTGSASWYTQLTVWTIKLGPWGAWQKANSLLGHLQPGQVPEEYFGECFDWGVFWLKSLLALPVSFCTLYINTEIVINIISRSVSRKENRTYNRYWRSSTPAQCSYVFGFNLLVQKFLKSWENDLNIKESDKGVRQLHHCHHCNSATKCFIVEVLSELASCPE